MAAITPAPSTSTNVEAILSDLATGSVLDAIVCLGAVESTQAYNPALVPHSKVICPVDHPLITTAQLTGCCGGLASVIDGTIACCPCGAFCTGSARAMVQWSDGLTGPVFSGFTLTTGSMVDGDPAATTDVSLTDVIVSPTIAGSASSTSTSSVNAATSVSSGALLTHSLLFVFLKLFI